MKEKGIRYSTTGLTILIALVIILSNIFSIYHPVFENKFVGKDTLKKDFIINRTYPYIEDINRSQGDYENIIYNQMESPFRYYFIKNTVINYQATEEYYKKNPERTVYKHKTKDNSFFTFHDLDSKEKLENLYDDNGNSIDKYYDLISDGTGPFEEKFEEPIYIEQYVNNNKDLKFNKNPEELKERLKNDNYFIFDSKIKKPKVVVNNEKSFGKDGPLIMDTINSQIQLREKDDNSYYKGVVVLDRNLTSFYEDMNEKVQVYDRTINMTIFSLIVFFLFLIIGSFTGYKKSRNVQFYKALTSIPLEIYAIVIIAMGYSLELLSQYVASNNWYELPIDVYMVLYISLTLFLLAMILIVLYFVNGLKSLYHEGFKSYLFQNSILFRFMRGIINLTRKIVNRIYRMIIGTNITDRRRRLFSFIIIWFVGSLIFGFQPFVSIGLFFILAVLYYLLNRILSDVQNIEDATYEINKGNFNINLNEESTYFGNISRNLNNINESLTNAMAKELKSERMKTELITNLSHDLKTPLTAIINYSDLASHKDISNDEREKYLEIVNEKSMKLKTLIERLFEVSKVTSKNVTLNYMDIDLNQMINQMIGEWHEDFSRKNIEVVFNSRKESTICKLDGEQTSRIFDNMFSNINKYAQENTRVYIDLIQRENTKIIMKNVSKYSLNISPEELKERFTRGDESRNTEGSGLGLAIASSLTELQGGKFDIEIDGDLFKTIITFNNNETK